MIVESLQNLCFCQKHSAVDTEEQFKALKCQFDLFINFYRNLNASFIFSCRNNKTTDSYTKIQKPFFFLFYKPINSLLYYLETLRIIYQSIKEKLRSTFLLILK